MKFFNKNTIGLSLLVLLYGQFGHSNEDPRFSEVIENMPSGSKVIVSDLYLTAGKDSVILQSTEDGTYKDCMLILNAPATETVKIKAGLHYDLVTPPTTEGKEYDKKIIFHLNGSKVFKEISCRHRNTSSIRKFAEGIQDGFYLELPPLKEKVMNTQSGAKQSAPVKNTGKSFRNNLKKESAKSSK